MSKELSCIPIFENGESVEITMPNWAVDLGSWLLYIPGVVTFIFILMMAYIGILFVVKDSK